MKTIPRATDPRVSMSARQEGWTILEIVIAIAIMGVMLAGIMSMQNSNITKQAGMHDAEIVIAFQKVAAQFFTSNRHAIMSAIETGTDADKYCRIGATDLDPLTGVLSGGVATRSESKGTCAFDAITLSTLGLWPSSMRVPNSTDDRLAAILRQVVIDDTPTKNAEMLVVEISGTGALSSVAPWSQDRSSGERVRAAAERMGVHGGYVPVGNLGNCVGVKSQTEVELCGRGWTATLNDFVDDSEMTIVRNALPD